MNIMQGDAYPIEIEIKQNGDVLTPDMIDDLEICVGDDIRKTYANKEAVHSDGYWYIRLTQEDTFGMDEGSHKVTVRVKYKNQPPDVVGRLAGRIKVFRSHSKEVL